jgi:hypothetical protein
MDSRRAILQYVLFWQFNMDIHRMPCPVKTIDAAEKQGFCPRLTLLRRSSNIVYWMGKKVGKLTRCGMVVESKGQA